MKKRFALLLILTLIALPQIWGQKVPTPKEHFGFNIGDDYSLATYTQAEAYFKILANSDRAELVEIGLTEEGRHQQMLIISSPENIKNLAKYKDISSKMAHAQGITESQARVFANEGKAVVWIDGGLHATETVGTNQLIETAYQLISRTDKETMDILSNVIILLVPANPDGQELVASWYMKEPDPTKRRTNIPRLYHKYAGHDNNRDFYMLSLKETVNMSRQLYIEWIPQILYNHHQSGPAGTVVAGPPFRDPFNYVYDPLVITSLDAVGAAMASRLIAENKPGYTQKGGSQYSTWYNGGLRTTGYFHNIIGLLTEIIGSPTPSEIPIVTNRLLPSSANPFPIEPQKWNFRKSIDYSVSLNYAVLNYASRQRSDLLYNIYKMGMNSIEKGNTDTWTTSPKSIEAMTASSPGGAAARPSMESFTKIMKDPAKRDPRAYIVPSDQPDFPTAVRFINCLIGSGIQIHKASTPFTVSGKTYPAGSYIVKTAQAFRPHVIDLFEPQDHPNDFQYPGGPPIAPYDAAGWTLAYQMGISFDRIQDELKGDFQVIPYGEKQSYAIPAISATAKGGYVFSPKVNNSFIVVNDLIKAGVKVYRLPEGDKISPAVENGTFYVPNSGKSQTILFKSASDNGVKVAQLNQTPSVTERILPARIAIFDRYGGSMPTGWLSLVMEQFSFPYQYVYPQKIDAGDLRKQFDIIIFTSGAIPATRRATDNNPALPARGGEPNYDSTPEEYRFMMGSLTAEKSIPELKKFVEGGGIIVAIESNTNLASHLNIPIKNALVKTDVGGQQTSFSRTEYYIPGSILAAEINTKERANWGMPSTADFNFDNSNVFKVEKDAVNAGVKTLAWFPTETPLRSGWALGQKNLKDGAIALEVPVGAGKVFMFGTDITFRSQPHGLFKMLFNQLYINEAGKK